VAHLHYLVQQGKKWIYNLFSSTEPQSKKTTLPEQTKKKHKNKLKPTLTHKKKKKSEKKK
jgi:hypothetical protein